MKYFLVLSLITSQNLFASCLNIDKFAHVKKNYQYIFHVKVISSSGKEAQKAPIEVSMESSKIDPYKHLGKYLAKRRELAKQKNCFYYYSALGDHSVPNYFEKEIGSGPDDGRIICRYKAELEILKIFRGHSISKNKKLYIIDHFITSIFPGTDVIRPGKEYLIGFRESEFQGSDDKYIVKMRSRLCEDGIYEVKDDKNPISILNYEDLKKLEESMKDETSFWNNFIQKIKSWISS